MPALLVQQAGIAAEQFGPGLVAGDIGHDHVGARGAERFGLGEDRRHQHRAGMAAQTDIVVVERVRRGAVDPGRFGRGALFLAERERGRTGGGRKDLLHDAHAILATSGDHGADAVDEAEASNALCAFG